MALINCSKCGNQISDKSNRCIHCGYSVKCEYRKKIVISSILFIILSLLLSFAYKYLVEKHTSLILLLVIVVIFVIIILILIYLIRCIISLYKNTRN